MSIASGDDINADDMTASLVAQIAADSPLSLARYIEIALSTASAGYYQSSDPFGQKGDFITAPEISGLFGEMCGLFLAHMFELGQTPEETASGHQKPAIIECGPGRGTLMADMRHVWEQLMPDLTACPVHLIETSPYLRTLQEQALPDAVIHWHDDLSALPAAPLYGIANEFFDALPVAHAICRTGIWRHRLVTATPALGFVEGKPLTDAELEMWRLDTNNSGPSQEGDDMATPLDGAIAESCALGEDIMRSLAAHIARFGGAILIIDYGKTDNRGDTVQAVAAHKPVDLFYQPGQADISHWVDFGALAACANAAGARLVGPVEQGSFLTQIGLKARAEQAAAHADPEMRRALLAAYDRLVSPAQMGSAFKVALLVPQGDGTPPGFVTHNAKTESSTRQDR
ncbi:class I SAM-dependent methyltransferase [Candidatus Puniceispirillum sp.]|uniref:class I SAM-dependent methyltransferase n=1 Tax=Candidatus Puniceispirillum sp. TaxID=2026719 RepID=UPI003F696F32